MSSLSLLECVELIEETKENSKNALIGKGLEIDESYGLSQVDEKIAEIQAGGGTQEFTCIDYLEYDGQQYKDNLSYIDYKDYGFGRNLTFKIKMKQGAYIINKPTSLTIEPALSYDYFNTSQEYTCTITDNSIRSLNGISIILERIGSDYISMEIPDVFVFVYKNCRE